ncbi:UNVERIFIED_CONTAM: hypothetical protein GTU68_012896, partial [Idotea baltica]|nr:hypothetical protein [Idotea baltica]
LNSGIIAAGAILYYLEETEHKQVKHISSISRIEEDKYVWLDKFTIRNLELIFPQQDGGVPLIDILDQSITPMGGRLMKKWLIMPLKEKNPINDRHQVVEAFYENEVLREELDQLLKHIADLERLISKVAVRRVNPREMNLLKRSLQQILPVKKLLSESDVLQLNKLADQINPCEFLLNKIDTELKEDVPMLANLGNIIKDGIDNELDDLRKISYSGKDYLVQIQQREIKNTGISSLKIAYNKVFGYYLEVTNSHKDKVPVEWIRKQTLVNAERYITEELKVYEEKILGAEDKIHVIEQRIFNELVESAIDFVGLIQQDARSIAAIDCLLSFANLANRQNYVRPKVTDEKVLDIKEGRHPVIEQQLPPGEEYVPNDVFLDNDSQQIMIITGPNMAGKSALLRQTALIALMAQIGSYVPASLATVGIIDKIFTRVGASDNLSKGTSTYDGISIAWSIVEYLHNNVKQPAKTLFATHYHELNQLTNDFPRIKNFNVSVKESGDKIIFLRKLKEGGSEHSFGIHVAQMAGMPNPIVIRANEIMHHLEKEKISQKTDKKIADIPKSNYQLSMFESDPSMEEVRGMLGKIDVNTISPIEALLKINEMKSILKGTA